MYFKKCVPSLLATRIYCRLNINVDVFAFYNGNNTCEWIIIFEFVFRSYKLIYIKTLFVINNASSVVFGHVCAKNEFWSAISDRSWEMTLLKCNPKQPKTINCNMSEFEENRSSNTDVRVPQRFYTKWPPWRHQITFSKSEKNGTGKHPREYLCGFLSKSGEPGGL